MPAHDAAVLLRSSFSSLGLMHVIRCSPCHGHLALITCHGHLALITFDDLLRSDVSFMTNSKLFDIQWTRASLPIRAVDLGIRRTCSLALSAFLASATGTADLQTPILGQYVVDPDTAVKAALQTWSSLYNRPSTCSGPVTVLSNNLTCRQLSPPRLPLRTVQVCSLSRRLMIFRSLFQFRRVNSE